MLLFALIKACEDEARCLKGIRRKMSASIWHADWRCQRNWQSSEAPTKSLKPMRRGLPVSTRVIDPACA